MIPAAEIGRGIRLVRGGNVRKTQGAYQPKYVPQTDAILLAGTPSVKKSIRRTAIATDDARRLGVNSIMRSEGLLREELNQVAKWSSEGQ